MSLQVPLSFPYSSSSLPSSPLSALSVISSSSVSKTISIVKYPASVIATRIRKSPVATFESGFPKGGKSSGQP